MKENIALLKQLDDEIEIKINHNSDNVFFSCDKEQIGRVFLNLIKNSIESIQQKEEIEPNFDKKILIEISNINEHIKVVFVDNGIGFDKLKNTKNIKDILNPYFTTKKNGTGLGLSIVNKIINDHNGELKFYSISNGAKVEINFK